MKYSDKRREAVLRKLMPPNNKTVAEVAAEEGISEVTIYKWRKQARDAGQLLPDHGSGPEGWSSHDKFNAVLESAALSEAELAEYCDEHLREFVECYRPGERHKCQETWSEGNPEGRWRRRPLFMRKQYCIITQRKCFHVCPEPGHFIPEAGLCYDG